MGDQKIDFPPGFIKELDAVVGTFHGCLPPLYIRADIPLHDQRLGFNLTLPSLTYAHILTIAYRLLSEGAPIAPRNPSSP